MNLIVDIGNTRTKYAAFEEGVCVAGGVGVPAAYHFVLERVNEGKHVDVILSSTGAISQGVRRRLQGVARFFCEVSPEMPLPIRLGYDTPRTLGVDRIAGCVGGVHLFPGRDLLIIDSGTAITFDFVSADGVFLGGNISPGMAIRFRALNEFTASLPLVACSPDHGYMGTNTRDAILNGVMNGILFEMRGYIDALRAEKPDAVVVVTGGGGKYVQKTLNRAVVFEERLVMTGLNRILEYQKTVNNEGGSHEKGGIYF